MRGHFRSASGSTGRTIPACAHVRALSQMVQEGISVELMRIRLARMPQAVIDEMHDVLVSKGYSEALPETANV